MGHRNDFDLGAWVAASCEAQGVPVKVTDALVVDRVRVLLGGGAQRANPTTAAAGSPVRTASSEPPHDLDSGGVQLPGSPTSGVNNDPVNNGSDDRSLLIEGEAGPLSA